MLQQATPVLKVITEEVGHGSPDTRLGLPGEGQTESDPSWDKASGRG